MMVSLRRLRLLDPPYEMSRKVTRTMPLSPHKYLHLSLPNLVRDLANADPRDVNLPRPAEVVPHGPGLRPPARPPRWLIAAASSAPTRGYSPAGRSPRDRRARRSARDVPRRRRPGWVYAGRVKATNKVVAVKVVGRGSGDDPLGWGAARRVLLRRVRHRNVLRVLRAEPAGAFWVVLMELVQGEELARGRLAAGEARICFGQLADALPGPGRNNGSSTATSSRPTCCSAGRTTRRC